MPCVGLFWCFGVIGKTSSRAAAAGLVPLEAAVARAISAVRAVQTVQIIAGFAPLESEAAPPVSAGARECSGGSVLDSIVVRRLDGLGARRVRGVAGPCVGASALQFGAAIER